MRVEFHHVYEAPASVVWSTLLDPDALARCLPGCTRLEAAGGGIYEATLELGVGPVKGTFGGRVRLTDLQPQESFRLIVEGGAGSSQVRGEGMIRLTQGKQGETHVDVAGEAVVTGALAAVGQRLLGSVARSLVGSFFTRMEAEVKARRATGQEPLAGGSAGGRQTEGGPERRAAGSASR